MFRLITAAICVSIVLLHVNLGATENVLLENTNLTGETSLIVPHLNLRSTEHGKYLLEVYNPEGLANFSADWNTSTQITNPRCVLEGGSLLKLGGNRVSLEFMNYTDWLARNEGSLKYAITKAVFKIVVEGQGYIQCSAAVNGDPNDVVSDRKLYRYVEHSFSVTIKYNCSLIQCDDIGMIANNLSRSFNKEINTTYLPINNIRAIPIKKSIVVNDSMSIIYRTEIYMLDHEDLKFPVAKQTTTPKFKDWELLLFLTNIISLFIKHNRDHAQIFTNIRSTKYCHTPSVKLSNESIILTLHYPTTDVGQTMVPEELCVSRDGGLYAVECEGDFINGAHFNNTRRANWQCVPPSPHTDLLYQLSIGNNTRNLPVKNVLETLHALVTTQTNLTTQNLPIGTGKLLSKADFKYAADVLSNIAPETVRSNDDLRRIATIASVLIGAQKDTTKKGIETVVNMTQHNSNSSNRLLDSLDRILNAVKLSSKSELIVEKKFTTLILDLSSQSNFDEIRGLAVVNRKSNGYNDFTQQDIVTLRRNNSLESVLEMDIALAVLVPDHLFDYDDGETHRLVINLFRGDSLFETQNTTRHANHVLSVTLDGKRHQDLKSPLILMFGSDHRNLKLKNDVIESGSSPCVFWDFEANLNKGDWSTTGCTLAKPLEPENKSHVDVCICTHLTHFAELLHESQWNIIHDQFNDRALDIITITGCLLSLLGLLGIAVTAIVFPAWRKGANKKIQLNLCAALGFLMVSILVKSFLNPTEAVSSFWDSFPCIITGILLHYSISASFCWMIVAAWGQYLRLTKPLESLNRKPHYVLKASVFGWGLPIIPCAVNIYFGVYNPPLCYPSGFYLYFSVFLPVVFAVALNMTIFCLIIFSIYNCCGFGIGLVHLRNNQNERKIALRKLSTVLFLFLLLGLSWIFGILNFPYVFCLTASMQGFAVFIFFVLLDKNTKEKWSELFGKSKKDKTAMYSYSSSADFVRRWSQLNSQRTTRISTLSNF